MMRKVKIVLVGAAHTGKTSLVNRFVFDEFTLHTVPTTQPAFSQKKVSWKGYDLSLEIWDTAGQERFHALSPLFYRDAEAGVIVFDLTDPESVTRAEKWMSELKQARGDNIRIVVAGNKCDLTNERMVSQEAGLELAAKVKAQYYETSALHNENIDLLFGAIIDAVVEKFMANDQIKNEESVQFDAGAAENERCC